MAINTEMKSAKRTWLIIGITAVIIIIALIVLYYSIKASSLGKAVGAPCTVDSDCDLVAGEICVAGFCSLPSFNLDIQCPSAVSPGQTFQCDIILDRPVTGFFGAQFVINAPGFNSVQPFIQGQNNVRAYSTGLGQQTLVFKSTADGQPAGAVATISLVALNRIISNIFLSDLIIATGSNPAQVSVSGSSLVGGICQVNNDCVQGVSCSNGFCGGAGAGCTQNTNCISGLCSTGICSTQPEICNDGLDNDADSRIDCSDTNCINDPSCRPAGTSQCQDGIDNDQDSFIDLWGGCDIDGNGVVDVAHYLITSLADCPAGTMQFIFADPLCVSSQGVAEGELCTNNVDDDGDQLIDCADSSCSADPACVITTLKGDVNNDGSINILDVLAIVNHIINVAPLQSPTALTAADANCDSSIDIRDVLAVVNRIINPSQPPIC